MDFKEINVVILCNNHPQLFYTFVKNMLMEERHRTIWCMVLVLCLAIISCGEKKEGQKGLNHSDTTNQAIYQENARESLSYAGFVSHNFPIIDFPSTYIGEIKGTRYAIFIESSGENMMKGHYMSLEAESSDTIAFKINTNRRSYTFISGDNKTKLKLYSISLDNGMIHGKYGTRLFLRHSFDLSPIKTPDFVLYDTTRYNVPTFDVGVKENVIFANVEGYWDNLDEANDNIELIRNLSKTLKKRDLNLAMDIYFPINDTLSFRPLIMLIHGGAFYMGTKNDEAMTKWCKYFASMGYVTASIDYRIGFKPVLVGIERAGYQALQDAHAAMRYLVANSNEYQIDTSMIFVGGSSAGGITALNLAYMNNNTRPKSSYSGLFMEDLGPIESSGNDITTSFTIKGVVDMWGAVSDIQLIDNHNIPIIAFHGDEDNIVPYGYDYPFMAAGAVKKALFNKMYGSSCIVERAKAKGTKAELYTFKGYKHSPHVDENDSLNENFYFIRDHMKPFFREIVIPDKPRIVWTGGSNYAVVDGDINHLTWAAEGGLIIGENNTQAEVIWISNAPNHELKASGVLRRGVGFTDVLQID
jgi:Esterase/lipase